MVRIRLAKYGRKNKPSYRIVVIDSKKKRDGKYLEKLGYYNPTEDDRNVVFDKDRYEYWLKTGAQPSEAVNKLVNGKYVFKPYNPKEDKKSETEDNIEETGNGAEDKGENEKAATPEIESKEPENKEEKAE